MVSVLPATVADAVCTVAGVALWPAVALLAEVRPAAAAVTPPAAATAARPIPAMMSLGCRMVGSLGEAGRTAVVPLSTTYGAEVLAGSAARRPVGATCVTLLMPACRRPPAPPVRSANRTHLCRSNIRLGG